MIEPSLAGHLLVATPLIDEPTFRRTVVLLLAHAEEGALGVVLNRPSDTPVVEVLAGWDERVAAPGVLFDGGPVSSDALLGLAAAGPVDLNLDPPAVEAVPEVRIFAGQAGWGPGQLEDEIGERAWWVVDAAEGDLFTRDPSELWVTVLRRQPAPTGWFANLPDDLRTG